MCYFVLFYCLLVFSMFYRSFEENEPFMEISGLKDKSWKKLEFCQSDRVQGSCNWAHQHSSAQDKERAYLCSCAQEEDRSQCVRTNSTTALFWRVGPSGILQLGLNPTIFRVSRVSLDSINRLLNTKTHMWFWRRIYDS